MIVPPIISSVRLPHLTIASLTHLKSELKLQNVFNKFSIEVIFVAKSSKGQANLHDLPAITAEAREDQMIAKAMDLAQRKLEDGTASNQLIVHYLRLGSLKERKNLEILEAQRQLYVAKTKQIEAEQSTMEMYKEAMEAFKSYSGDYEEEEYYDD